MVPTIFFQVLSFGVTVHKSQGLSVDNAIVDLAGPEEEGGIFASCQAYVAISRVHNPDNLHFIRFNPSAIFCDPAPIKEYNRLRSGIGLPVFSLPAAVVRKRRMCHSSLTSCPSKAPSRAAVKRPATGNNFI